VRMLIRSQSPAHVSRFICTMRLNYVYGQPDVRRIPLNFQASKSRYHPGYPLCSAVHDESCPLR
jgi:hypothetical protein